MKNLNQLVSTEIKTFYFESHGETVPQAENEEDRERAAELVRMAEDREVVNAAMLNQDFPVMSGEQYAQSKEITLKKPVTQEAFDALWESIQTDQAKEGFSGMQIPENLKDTIWDYVKHTFEADGLSGEALTTALKAKIEKEAIFFKMQALDTPPAVEEGETPPTFPGGFTTEGDYIDWLAKGSPDPNDPEALNDASDDIDPELLAYLRATNTLGLGQKMDAGSVDMESLQRQYASVMERMKGLNISNLDQLRANIGKLGENPSQAAVTQLVTDGTIDPSRVAQYESGGGVNTLWDLIRVIIEFATGKKYDGRNFTDRFAGAENLGILPNGNGEATPDFARKALEEATGNNKAILAKALEYIGVSESGNPGLIRKMHQSAGLNAGTGTPWCASFISHVTSEAGVNCMKSASSKAFMGAGTAVSPGDAQPGDLCIFSRGNGGHIGVFVGWDQNRKPIIIGGNQSNQVSIKSSRQQLIGIRRV